MPQVELVLPYAINETVVFCQDDASWVPDDGNPVTGTALYVPQHNGCVSKL